MYQVVKSRNWERKGTETKDSGEPTDQSKPLLSNTAREENPFCRFHTLSITVHTKVNKKTFINIFKVFYIRKFFCHLTSPVSCLEMIECLTGIESSVSDPSRREIPCIVWRIEIDKTTPQTQEEWYYCFCWLRIDFFSMEKGEWTTIK